MGVNLAENSAGDKKNRAGDIQNPSGERKLNDKIPQ